jgi:hypothetical protein
MLIEHRGKVPTVDPSAYVAPTAVLCGDVRLGPESRVLFGAVLSAEDSFVEIGARCVVMENALVRGRGSHPARVGDDVLTWDHKEIWRIQKALDFPRTVYGLPRSASARERMERQSEWFGAHREDRVVDLR